MQLDSEKLRGAMFERCFNIETLSKAANVSRATVSRALSCRGNSLNMQNVGKIAKALNVPAASLLKDRQGLHD